MGFLDDAEVGIECDCGRTTEKTIGWIRRNRQFTCACGTVITLDSADLRRKMDKIDRDLRDLGFK